MEASLRDFGRIVDRLTRGEDIGRDESRDCWRQICNEEQPDLQQGAFIAALVAKGETPEEIAGAFEALYEHDTTKIALDAAGPLVDNCGTGADTLKTFNISTAAAIVAAASGAQVYDEFAIVLGGSAAGDQKAENLVSIAARLGLERSRLAYVGDSPSDMQAASEASVLPLGAAWSAQADAARLAAAEADLIFHDLAAFRDWLDLRSG